MLIRAGRVVVALALLAGCGSGDGATVAAGADSRWERQHLEGELGPDYVVQLAADGDELLVVGASDDGFLHAFGASGSGAFQPGTPTDLSLGYPGIGALARLDGRWLALGGTRESGGEGRSTFVVRVLQSADGERWGVVDASGFDDPGEVSAVASVDGRLVAGGTLRLAEDPSSGGFRPAVWTTDDGRGWTQVELPMDDATEGGVADVAAVGDAAFATGHLDDRGVLWSSTDRGATWAIADDATLPEVSTVGGIAVVGETVVVSAWKSTPELGEEGEYGVGLLLRSTDAGAHWDVASAPPPSPSPGYAGPVHAGGGYFFVLDEGDRRAGYGTEVCYADIELCRDGPAPAATRPSLYASQDGDRWTRVDTRGIDDALRFAALGGTADGRIVALQASKGGTDAWIWPANEPLAMREAEPEAPPPTAEVDLIGPDDEVDEGHRYALPLYVHCGLGRLGLDGRAWQLVGPEPIGEDGYPADWPLVGDTLYGFVTLVDADTAEYSIGEGEVIAAYEPTTSDPVGCA